MCFREGEWDTKESDMNELLNNNDNNFLLDSSPRVVPDLSLSPEILEAMKIVIHSAILANALR